MTEFLIYNKTHWMDLPSKDRPDLTGYENVRRKIQEAGFLTKEEDLLRLHGKYIRRMQKGDIVEVQPDGFWTNPKRGFDIKAFCLVCIPGLKFEDAKHLMEIWEDREPHPTIPQKEIITTYKIRKYQVDLLKIALNDEKRAVVNSIAKAYITDKSK